jgi:phosphoglycolate phosphatase
VRDKFAAVLFDLDGTLADTAPDMAHTVNIMLRDRGKAPIATQVVRPYVSQGARGMIRAAFGATPEHPEFKAMREEFLQIYADNLSVDTRLFEGMAGLLAALESNAVAWGVVTNKFERLARPVIEGLGLTRRAAVIIGGDTCARPKPFPDPLLHAAALLNLPPSRVLYVGDDERDVQAAHAAGMRALVAGYGYLGDGPPPALWNADGIVNHPDEIAPWIAAQH